MRRSSGFRDLAVGLCGAWLSGCAALGPQPVDTVDQLLARDPAQWTQSPPAPWQASQKIGISLVPSVHWQAVNYQEQLLLFHQLKARLRALEAVETVVFIPPNQLSPATGFQSLDELAARHGLSRLALVALEPRPVPLEPRPDETAVVDRLLWQWFEQPMATHTAILTEVVLDLRLLDAMEHRILHTIRGDGTDFALPDTWQQRSVDQLDQMAFVWARNQLLESLARDWQHEGGEVEQDPLLLAETPLE